MEMTHDLVAKTEGTRTRIAQEAREHGRKREDQALDKYLDLSSKMDKSSILLRTLVPRGWLMLGLLGLAPSFVAGSASPATLAVGLGGVLLAYRALNSLGCGLQYLLDVWMSWNKVAVL